MRARVIAAVLIAASSAPVRADSFDLDDVDKRAHIAASYGLTLTGAVIARHYELPRWQAIALAAAATVVIATTKELLDAEYSWGDQLGNAIGISGATIVVLAFRL